VAVPGKRLHDPAEPRPPARAWPSREHAAIVGRQSNGRTFDHKTIAKGAPRVDDARGHLVHVDTALDSIAGGAPRRMTMPCYVHFWENAGGQAQSLAYEERATAESHKSVFGGTIRPYPFTAAEYNRRTDPPPAHRSDEETIRLKARELAEMAGRRPSGEVAMAIERALKEANKTG
jgi:hypothetical protein